MLNLIEDGEALTLNNRDALYSSYLIGWNATNYWHSLLRRVWERRGFHNGNGSIISIYYKKKKVHKHPNFKCTHHLKQQFYFLAFFIVRNSDPIVQICMYPWSRKMRSKLHVHLCLNVNDAQTLLWETIG